jgi:glycogen(starch) synthase
MAEAPDVLRFWTRLRKIYNGQWPGASRMPAHNSAEPPNDNRANSFQGRKLRVAYLHGSTDALVVYSEFLNCAPSHYFGSNYLKQFFQLCIDIHADAYVVTNLPTKFTRVAKDSFTMENRPNPSGRKGLSYHLTMIGWYLTLVPRLLRFRPDLVILTLNEPYWFVLSFLMLFQIAIIPSLHVTLWPKLSSPKFVSRVLWRLNEILLFRHIKSIVVASNDIAEQVRELLGTRSEGIAFYSHLPTYERAQFAGMPAPSLLSRRPFRVFFAGRIEKNKGIFDLVEIARRLELQRPGGFCFDVCGDGNELTALKHDIRASNLEAVVCCHGYCDATKLAAIISESHVCLVPTKAAFAAGFEMVCAEAILAGRPLVTSPACPALEYVERAAVAVEPDNVEQYCIALLRLYEDQSLFMEKQAACASLQAAFYDVNRSWKVKMFDAVRKSL